MAEQHQTLRNDLLRARRLSEGSAAQARILAAGLELRFRPRSAASPLCLNLNLGARPTPYWLFDLAHLWNLDEVWLAGEYAHLARGDFDLVLDLGANVGAASIWLHEHHPEARIVAVEPDPRTAPLLRRNTEYFSRITVVEAAVGVEEGTAQLMADAFSWGSRIADADTLTPDVDRRAAKTWTVKVMTIPSLVRDAGVSTGARVLAKVDIEGSEWSLLRTPSALGCLRELYGETHRFGAPADSVQFFADASRAADFEALPAPPTFFHWRRPSR
jgi:FkbM family methyltransferase